MEAKIKRRQELLTDLKVAHSNMFEAQQKFYRLQNFYGELKREYEALDYEIALKTKLTKEVKAKQAELTIEQILAIANKLGIEVTPDD